MGRTSRSLCLVLVVLAGSMLASCKSSSTPSGMQPRAYIAGFCGAFYSWGSSLKAEIASVKSESSSVSSLSQGRQLLVDFMGKVVDHTEAFIASVKALGPPAVANGQQFQDKLLSFLENAQTQLQDAEAKARTLPIDSPAAFSSGAQKVFGSLGSASGALSGLGLASSSELDQAFKADPTCKKANTLFSSLGG